MQEINLITKRLAEERKAVGVLRPSSASLERRMAEADSRRKVIKNYVNTSEQN